jgi:hypothetical protein
MAYTFRLGDNTVGLIIRETCQLIYDRLQPEYLTMPKTSAEWEKISLDFWRRWNIPNCLGSIDGKHCVLRKPSKSGSLFYNYKGII